MCTLADEFGTFRASLLQFMLRSMLILSRSCCIDLRTARCLRAYWTMFNDRFARQKWSSNEATASLPYPLLAGDGHPPKANWLDGEAASSADLRDATAERSER